MSEKRILADSIFKDSFFILKPATDSLLEYRFLQSLFPDVRPTDNGNITFPACRFTLLRILEHEKYIMESHNFTRLKDVFMKNVRDSNVQLEVANMAYDCMVKEYIENGEVPSLPDTMCPLEEPRSYQALALAWMAEMLGVRNSHALFFDMGIGKTYTALTWAEWLVERGIINRILVIAPLSVARNDWGREIEKFTSLTWRLLWTHKQGKYKKRHWKKCFCDNPNILIVNPGRGRTIRSLREPLIEWSPGMVIVDESAMIKNRDTQTFREIMRISERSEFRLILNGTPAPNGLLDLWSQFFFLDRGIALGESFNEFRSRYMYNISMGFWKQKSGADSAVWSRIRPLMLRFMKTDVLDGLPDRVMILKRISMGQKQALFYDSLVDNQLAEYEGAEVSFETLLPKFTKLRQVTSGFFISDEKELVEIENAKMECFIDLANEIALDSSNKCIIWCTFRHEIKLISEALEKMKLAYRLAYGGQSTKKTGDSLRDFSSDDSVMFLVAHPASIGLGVNLQVANYVIYFSLSENLAHYEQSLDRNFRIGQERRVFVYFLVAKNTYDEKVVLSLRKKQDAQDLLTGSFSVHDLSCPDIEEQWDNV